MQIPELGGPDGHSWSEQVRVLVPELDSITVWQSGDESQQKLEEFDQLLGRSVSEDQG